MSLSKKGYKTINHRDVQYRWLMKNRNGINEASIYTNAAIGGRELIAELPRIVTLAMVMDAADFGNVRALQVLMTVAGGTEGETDLTPRYLWRGGW